MIYITFTVFKCTYFLKHYFVCLVNTETKCRKKAKMHERIKNEMKITFIITT